MRGKPITNYDARQKSEREPDMNRTINRSSVISNQYRLRRKNTSSLLSHTSYLKRKTADRFTLIELLIVVAIIAILAGMLLPALNKARDSAHKIACTSNHKTLTSAGIQYCMDNNDYFYAPVDRAGNKNGCYNFIRNICAYAISPYLGKKIGLNVAGGLLRKEKINGDDAYFYTSKVLVCPGKKTNPTYDVTRDIFNYGWNSQLGSGSFYDGIAWSTWPMAKLGSVRKPSAILMFGDAGGDRWGANSTVTKLPPSPSSNEARKASIVRHGNMILFSYVDGHASPTKTNRPVYYKHKDYSEFTENK